MNRERSRIEVHVSQVNGMCGYYRLLVQDISHDDIQFHRIHRVINCEHSVLDDDDPSEHNNYVSERAVPIFFCLC